MTVQGLDTAAQELHDLVCRHGGRRRLDRTSDVDVERVLVDALDSSESAFREAIEGTEQDRAVAVHRAVRELARYRWGEKAGRPEEIRLRYKSRSARIASREPAPTAEVPSPLLAPASARVLAAKARVTQGELAERERQVREQARRELDRERARREWAAQEAERRRERSRWSRLGGLMGGGR